MEDYNFKNGKEFNNIIKKLLETRDLKDIAHFQSLIKNDERQFVTKGVLKLQNYVEKYNAEISRTKAMYSIEEEIYAKGYDYIIGIDEVGRGPFAGPVTVAGVILKRDSFIPFINDSKKLSKDMRNILNDEITNTCVDKIILSKDNNEVDAKGIKVCTISLMQDCVNYFLEKGYKNVYALVDAEKIPDIPIQQMNIIKGDSKSSSIAAASILAKVNRDTLMEELSKDFPQYDFSSNMGYNSPKHFEGIVNYGICPIHRKTFVKTALRNKGIDVIGTKYNIEF